MKIFLLPTILSLTTLVVGCGNKFEECIQNQQEEYRRLHPGASYSELARLRSGYEAMCSSFKK